MKQKIIRNKSASSEDKSNFTINSMEQFKIFAARGESEISNLCCPKGSDIYVSRESLFRFCKSHIRERSNARTLWTELVRLCNSTWKYVVDTSGIILKRVLPLSRTRFANDDEVSFLKSNVSKSACE